MLGLHSYGQSEPVHDDKAYTISSTYHEGQLKMYGHSVAQPNGLGTRPEYYMHQLNTWSMTGNKLAFLQGASAFKNAADLTQEYRNAAIEAANKVAVAVQAKGGDKNDAESDEDEGETEYETAEEITDEEEEDTDEGEEEAGSSNTILSFYCGTNENLSTLIEDEDESETSVENKSQIRPPAKRSSSNVHHSHRRKRTTGQSGSRRSSITPGSGSHQSLSHQSTASGPADCQIP